MSSKLCIGFPTALSRLLAAIALVPLLVSLSWSQAIEKVIYDFTGGSNGAAPYGGLILDSAGNLYGTTASAPGTFGYGTVFKLTPSNGVWIETVLHNFTGTYGGGDGDGPAAGLIFDSAGNLYGTTGGGGTNEAGTVFKLTYSSGVWTEAVLHSFAGSDGQSPDSGLIFDSKGNLYGTTVYG
ncbi:MAG: choice-of-anchor tandem repeat GloVer-containing protein, partial [Candidatus Sulfotelmatobacter sp.]